jgi:hypothetical protein
VVQQNFVVAKLTGNDPPTAAESLKLLLTLDADANPEALQDSKGVIHVLNRLIATNDDDGPVECIRCGPSWRDWPLNALPLHKLLEVHPPTAVNADNLLSPAIAGEPHPALGAIGRGEGDWVGLILLSLDLLSNQSPQIGVRGGFAGY